VVADGILTTPAVTRLQPMYTHGVTEQERHTTRQSGA
jgi:hypothetical protein